jgi:murein L,D-transpeptidase YafK
MLPELKQPEIIIRKKQRTLEVYDGGKLIKTFTMVLGFAPTGDKEVEGDGKTPEGEFYVFTKNDKSKFHLSLGLSYPSKADAARGLATGLITAAERDEIVSAIDKKKMPPQKTALGGEIYIHGGGIESDWTWGCVAL